MKRRASVRIVSYALALCTVAAGMAAHFYMQAGHYKRVVDNSYLSAVSQLVTSVSKLDSALKKGNYAGSASMAALLSAEVWKEAASAKAALSMLPITEIDLDRIQKFVSQAGEYAYTLLRKTAAGDPLTEEDRENLRSLSGACDEFSIRLSGLKSEINSGGITLKDMPERLKNGAASGQGPALATGGFPTDDSPSDGNGEQLNGDFPEYATLIYDGPYSDHIEKMAPAMLEGEAEVSQEDARTKAGALLEIPPDRLHFDGGNNGKMQTYCFSAETDGGLMQVELTKQGGYLLNYTNSRLSGRPSISPQDAMGRARDFMEKTGFSSMEESYYTEYQDIVTINFASAQNGVICYPDLVKVSVARDTGEVVLLESYGYIMNHKARNLDARPSTTAAEAQAAVNPQLTILSHGMALIPTEGKNETLCHEFKCETSEKTHVIVYVNAETGREENIFLLIEDENGTLTM